MNEALSGLVGSKLPVSLLDFFQQHARVQAVGEKRLDALGQEETKPLGSQPQRVRP
jgi:hypothetical protein